MNPTTVDTYPLDDIAHQDLDADTLLAVYNEVRALMAIDAPQFGSHTWTRLPDGDPAKLAATVRAALSWWTCMVFGAGVPSEVVDREVAARVAEASKAVHAADPKLFRRVASDRAQRRLQCRDRSVYGPRSEAAS